MTRRLRSFCRFEKKSILNIMVKRVFVLIVARVFLVNGKCEGKIKKEKYEWIKVNYIFKIISFS